MLPIPQQVEQLVAAGMFKSHDAVLEAALEALYRQRPEVHLKLIGLAYAKGDLSIGEVATIFNISIPEAQQRLRASGILLHGGPTTEAELMRDIANA